MTPAGRLDHVIELTPSPSGRPPGSLRTRDPRSAAATGGPSIPGIMTSISTASGSSLTAACQPSVPDPAGGDPPPGHQLEGEVCDLANRTVVVDDEDVAVGHRMSRTHDGTVGCVCRSLRCASSGPPPTAPSSRRSARSHVTWAHAPMDIGSKSPHPSSGEANRDRNDTMCPQILSRRTW